uniref:Spermidine synthase n=1 Tax=Novosphingobium flavum TaxID=1778672 RepID=A0A7X1FPK3_9SPHN|nr:hypothetical protein [Novosphingobium flavum]
MPAAPAARRGLFVAAIFAGSFLLFLVQPLVARLALPRLGGAPNVWNSAMLVYQALLLGGYLYAHLMGRWPVRTQGRIHLALLALAALTLPITLYPLAPPAPGSEVWWVPLLFLLTIGPVFLLVSAQAPLMQRWYAAAGAAGDPYPLYAASNLGSFAGLLAYPLLAEPLLSLHAQSWGWSAGYGLLLILVACAAWSRRAAGMVAAQAAEAAPAEPIPARRIALWLALSAVPSGLMLSTTTHLTTDVFAMPLLWVIPLGLYLLSFVVAFAHNRVPAYFVTLAAPAIMVVAGSYAMVSTGSGTMAAALFGVILLFFIAGALHSRLYDLRPAASQLTLFYFIMSVGGALGGLFCALIAPLVFDWAWEHPILILAAAALLPFPARLDWREMPGLSPEVCRVTAGVVFAFCLFLAWLLHDVVEADADGMLGWMLHLALAAFGLGLLAWRPLFVGVLLAAMLASGGWWTVHDTLEHVRTRSYFGIYAVRDYPQAHLRTLAHGTTLHGQQRTDPAGRRLVQTYYGPTSGAALTLGKLPQLIGPSARVGVVGLGAGTLACFHQPGQSWRFYEIDPAILAYSTTRRFTYLADCAPDARVTIGDARLELAAQAPGSLDFLAVDAFTSDAIPLHLLTSEAFGVYFRVLQPRGLLVVHISNRHIELEPVLAAIARQRGLAAMVRHDVPEDRKVYSPSTWVLFARDPALLQRVRAASPQQKWDSLLPPTGRAWTDDHASVLPYVDWSSLFRN